MLIVHFFLKKAFLQGVIHKLLHIDATMSTLLHVITSSVSAISIILCIIGNSLVCAVIKKNRDMRLVTDKSLNLSICHIKT